MSLLQNNPSDRRRCILAEKWYRNSKTMLDMHKEFYFKNSDIKIAILRNQRIADHIRGNVLKHFKKGD